MRDLNDKPLFVLVVWERRISPPAGRLVPVLPAWTGPSKPLSVGNADLFCHRGRAAPWRSI